MAMRRCVGRCALAIVELRLASPDRRARPRVAARRARPRSEPGEPDADCAAMLVAPAVAGDLGPAPAGRPAALDRRRRRQRRARRRCRRRCRRVRRAAHAGVASRRSTRSRTSTPTSADFDLARARGLIATSLVDLTGSAAETLLAVADGFTAHDCIVWWRDGNQMMPTAARPTPDRRLPHADREPPRGSPPPPPGTVITGGPKPRSVIADALRSARPRSPAWSRSSPTPARRFSAAERTDLKAIAARLTRELSWLTSHRRLVAEGERLLAASLHDPLTGAMTRGAFEQTIAHEVAAAGAARREADARGDRHRRAAPDQPRARPQGRRRGARADRRPACARRCAATIRSAGSAATSSPCCSSARPTTRRVRRRPQADREDPGRADQDRRRPTAIAGRRCARVIDRDRDRRAQRRGRARALLRRAAHARRSARSASSPSDERVAERRPAPTPARCRPARSSAARTASSTSCRAARWASSIAARISGSAAPVAIKVLRSDLASRSRSRRRGSAPRPASSRRSTTRTSSRSTRSASTPATSTS